MLLKFIITYPVPEHSETRLSESDICCFADIVTITERGYPRKCVKDTLGTSESSFRVDISWTEHTVGLPSPTSRNSSTVPLT